jgi:ubiquinol-cytochrome c reductase iron-sulfur subunit
MSDGVDNSRRHFLTVATTVTGAVGAGFAAIPFLSSWQPSARAQALGSPVEVDISKLMPGEMLRVTWRGQAVWVLWRSESMMQTLPEVEDSLRDPASDQLQQPSYAKNQYRSLKPEIFVVIGNCTHLGCSPVERFEVAPADLGPEWKGGFYCPCHGSRFDLAGRVYKGVPAPLNLKVPPYKFLTDSLILIGDDTGVA